MRHHKTLIRLLILFAATLATMQASALHPVLTEAVPVAPDKTAFESSYRGTDNVIARTPAGPLTERELFLYLVMTGHDDPRLLEQYRFVESDLDQAAFEARIQKAIQGWALTRLLARQNTRSTESDLAELRKQILLYPVHELVWIDKALAPDVRVVEEDIVKRYRENPPEAQAKPRVTVRYILIRVDSPAPRPTDPNNLPDAAWRNAWDEMEDIRDAAVLNPDAFAELAREHSEAPSAASGGKVSFSRDTFFDDFEEAAFTLDTKQISNIIIGPGGLYLLQNVETVEGANLPLDEVREKIRRVLALKQIKHRYAWEMNNLKEETRVFNYGAQIEGLQPQDPILIVSEWSITRRQAWQLFPDFVRENFLLDTSMLNKRLTSIAGYELIRQVNTSHGWNDTEMLQIGRELAEALYLAQRNISILGAENSQADFTAVRRYLQSRPQVFPFPKPTKQQEPATGIRDISAVSQMPQTLIDALAEGPGNDFLDLTEPRISLVHITIRDDKRLSEARHQWELDQMRAYLDDSVTRCKALRLEALADQSLTRHHHPADLPTWWVTNELRLVATDLSTVEIWTSEMDMETLDQVTRDRIAEVRRTLDNWTEMGVRFLPLLETSRSLTLFCVEQPDYRSDAIANYLHERFWDYYVRAQRIELLENLRSTKLQNQTQLQLPEK